MQRKEFDYELQTLFFTLCFFFSFFCHSFFCLRMYIVNCCFSGLKLACLIWCRLILTGAIFCMMRPQKLSISLTSEQLGTTLKVLSTIIYEWWILLALLLSKPSWFLLLAILGLNYDSFLTKLCENRTKILSYLRRVISYGDLVPCDYHQCDNHQYRSCADVWRFVGVHVGM